MPQISRAAPMSRCKGGRREGNGRRHTGKHEPLLQPKLETPRGESECAEAEDVGEEGHGTWMDGVPRGRVAGGG